METLVGDDYKDGHYHDASEHGLAWAMLNKMLHVIVFVYTLYGMIQFRVKFIRMNGLVAWLSRLIILHSFYLSAKFALIATLMYIYNYKLESRSVELSSFNCSLDNFPLLAGPFAEARGGPQQQPQQEPQPQPQPLLELLELPSYVYYFNYMPYLNRLIQDYGGPFKLLGNRATLMYGFYAIAVYIMLAIFPLELVYCVKVDFNFIRFVLSDPACMTELYSKRKRHLFRLCAWSRSQSDSLITQGAKMILIQRDLRSSYTADCNQLANFMALERRLERSPWTACLTESLLASGPVNKGVVRSLEEAMAEAEAEVAADEGEEEEEGEEDVEEDKEEDVEEDVEEDTAEEGRTGPGVWQGPAYWEASRRPPDDRHALGRPTRTGQAVSVGSLNRKLGSRHYRVAKLAAAGKKLTSSVKQLYSRLAINHQEEPSYAIRVANRNLNKFKPFVRTEVWFKASMIIYPIYIFFYFSSLIYVIGFIQLYFEWSLADVEAACGRAASPGAAGNGPPLARGWSRLDALLYYENIYTVLILSGASSFYCSYYFGTILELAVWLWEVSQQIDLCTRVIELNEVLQHPDEAHPFQALRLLRYKTNGRWPGDIRSPSVPLNKYANDFGGPNSLFPHLMERLSNLLASSKRLLLDLLLLRVGRLRALVLGRLRRPAHRQHRHAQLRELMAIKLLTKKETLMRATYVNMCLFFDELQETRFMTTIILKRTTQIASGFAFMASITRSQFKANFWHLTYLLLATFIVFNLYLACGAYINGRVNNMLVQVHSLISASLKSGGEDAALFDFWLRHVNTFGEDKDATAYNLYGYKVTWSNILNVSSYDVRAASREPPLIGHTDGHTIVVPFRQPDRTDRQHHS